MSCTTAPNFAMLFKIPVSLILIYFTFSVFLPGSPSQEIIGKTDFGQFSYYISILQANKLGNNVNLT